MKSPATRRFVIALIATFVTIVCAFDACDSYQIQESARSQRALILEELGKASAERGEIRAMLQELLRRR